MAILFDNKYRKITRSINNFVDDRTEVVMSVYDGIQAREHEKQIGEKLRLFRMNVTRFLTSESFALERKIREIQPIEEIADKELFLEEHSELKKDIEDFEELRQEGVHLIDGITKYEIKEEDLKHLNTWKELGLDEDLLQVIGFIGEEWKSLDGQVEPDLNKLYTEIKKKVASEVEDV